MINLTEEQKSVYDDLIERDKVEREKGNTNLMPYVKEKNKPFSKMEQARYINILRDLSDLGLLNLSGGGTGGLPMIIEIRTNKF
jgi:SNF2 family DNA or RNA helicase